MGWGLKAESPLQCLLAAYQALHEKVNKKVKEVHHRVSQSIYRCQLHLMLG